MSLSGIVLRSKNESTLFEKNAYGATRWPSTNTSVYFSERPRSAMPAAPAAKLPDCPSPQLFAELAAASRRKSATVTAPLAWISFGVIVCTCWKPVLSACRISGSSLRTA